MKTAPSFTNSVLQTFERKGPFMMIKAFVRQPPAGLWNQAGRPLGDPYGIVESSGAPSGRPLRDYGIRRDALWASPAGLWNQAGRPLGVRYWKNNFVIFPAQSA